MCLSHTVLRKRQFHCGWPSNCVLLTNGPTPYEFERERFEITMATATAKPTPSIVPLPFSNRIVPVNSTPEEFDSASGLPAGFLEFLAPLHAALTLRQRALVARRERALAEAHAGKLPDYLPPSVATTNSWRIELPAWCADQRNQMTGPADEADLVVKMLNSGAPGVMLDLEDSTANAWEHTICAGSRIFSKHLPGD